MGSIKFAEKTEISCPAEAVFDYTQDYTQRLSWDTFLRSAALVGGATKAGKGIRSYCVANNGLGMETEYVTFNRPKVTAVKMTKGPWMFESFLGSWNFKRLKAELTEVTFLYSFKLRFPFSLFGQMVKRSLRKDVKQRLADLRSSMESQTAANTHK